MQFQKNNLDKYQKSFRGNRRNPRESEYGEMAYVEPNVKEIRNSTMENQEMVGQPDQMSSQARDKPVYYQIYGNNMRRVINKPNIDEPMEISDEMKVI